MKNSMTSPRRACTALAGSLLLLSACGGGGDGSGAAGSAAAAAAIAAAAAAARPPVAAPPLPDPAPDPAAACKALVGSTMASADIGLATKGAVVTAAALVAPAAPLGEYCLVSGEIHAVDAAAQAIRFSIAMPTQWNGKAVHFGGGGLDGVVPDPTSPLLESVPPLAHGYAIFGSDGGHQAPGGDPLDSTFALNDEMLRNYAGDAVKKTHDVAIKLIRDRYQSAPTQTYFIGGSKGGHEGMTAMQKWAQDYDGMVLLFPAYSFTSVLLSWQQANRALHLGAGAGFLDPAKLQTLQNAELAACDGLDGATDGIVGNVAACTFSPTSLRCAGGADTGNACLSDAQVATASLLRGRTQFPHALKNGITSYAGFSVSTAFASTGGFGLSPAFPVGGASAAQGSMSALTDTLVRSLVLRDLAGNSLDFDPMNPGPYAARIQEISSTMDATSTDIEPFMKKGKWILVHGMSDSLIVSGASVDYYEALVARFGRAQVDGFMRFYNVPGFGHGTGLFNATGMKTLDALDAWVQTGTL
jgi:hypothetical protein